MEYDEFQWKFSWGENLVFCVPYIVYVIKEVWGDLHNNVCDLINPVRY